MIRNDMTYVSNVAARLKIFQTSRNQAKNSETGIVDSNKKQPTKYFGCPIKTAK